MTFSKINAWFHLWLGLASGIVVFILGITGAILVFEQEIKSVSSPWLHTQAGTEGEYLPPSVLYRAVEQVYPNREIESIWYPGHGKTAHLRIHDMDSVVYVNPYNAQVIATVTNNDFFQFIKNGHYYLWFPPEIGHQVTAWATLIFFLLTISGLILWWPKKWNRKTREQSFKIKWTAKFKRLNYDLHNVLGFYSLLLALLIAFTALMMGFSWFYNGVIWLAGGEFSSQRIKAVSDTTTIQTTNRLTQVDKAWDMGINQLGEHNRYEIILHFPETDSDPIYVCTDMYIGTWRDIYLDQHTLKELPASNKRLRHEDFANLISRSNYSLHVGLMAGLFTKIPYFLTSLICASLPVTGFYIWWGRKKKHKRKKPLKVPGEAIASEARE